MAKYLPLEIHENIFRQLDVDTQFNYAVALNNQRLLDIAVKNKVLQQTTGRNTEDVDNDRLQQLVDEYRNLPKVRRNVYPFLTSFFDKTFVRAGAWAISSNMSSIILFSEIREFNTNDFIVDEDILGIIVPGVKRLIPKLNKEQLFDIHDRLMRSRFQFAYIKLKDKLI